MLSAKVGFSQPNYRAALFCSVFVSDGIIITLAVLATVTWSAFCGKDLNWDQLNYHFYVAHSLVSGRLHQDFVAAGEQSYLNPLPYVPFYLMVVHHWHSLLIASILAALHSFNIVLAYLIAKKVMWTQSPRNKAGAIFAAILAFVSPVFLLEAGTTFADITTSALVLLGLLCTLKNETQSYWWKNPALLAGLCIGAATGLKQSNVIFGLACVPAMVSMSPSIKRFAQAMCWIVLGGIVGVTVTYAYWGWELWREFQNPFFPFFNTIFASPDYPLITHHHQRFLPDSILDYITLPFRMVQLRSWVYIESLAPDLRFAILFLIVATGGAMILLHRLGVTSIKIPRVSRQLSALWGFFIAGYLLWIWSSGNGRYGIVISILCGPMIATATYFVCSSKLRVLISGLILFVMAQSFHLSQGQVRWDSGPWTNTWYQPSIPSVLATEPYLYVNISSQSNSYIVPYLSPQSAFTNPIGQISVDLDGPGGNRLKQLFHQYGDHIRIVAKTPLPSKDRANTMADWFRTANSTLLRLGFEISQDSCLPIQTAGFSREGGQDYDAQESGIRRLITCQLKTRPMTLAETAERKHVQLVLERIISWCPKLFQPSHGVLEKTLGRWFINFADSDTMINLEANHITVDQLHSSRYLYLGLFDDWEQENPPLKCSDMPTRLRNMTTDQAT